MSRPLRLISSALLLLPLALAGCKTSTPYTTRYSPRKSYFVAPPEKTEKSAEELLKAAEVPVEGAPDGGAPPPPPPIPGLPGDVPPPPGIPAPPAIDPLAPAPAVPAPATPDPAAPAPAAPAPVAPPL